MSFKAWIVFIEMSLKRGIHFDMAIVVFNVTTGMRISGGKDAYCSAIVAGSIKVSRESDEQSWFN